MLAVRPLVLSFVFGIPSAAILQAGRDRGIKTVDTATTVDEAVAIEAAGTTWSSPLVSKRADIAERFSSWQRTL
ncbi:hypothetical protein [Caballeronia sp. 15711]|uniref:hypothetical protein n=1 Tax=Caballeronia sp. 15711 TaxID=3391029 RepID=UPI0039E61E2F